MAGIEATEREFEARLAAFGKDARTCATLAYTGFALDSTAGRDLAIHDRLNRHPGFWIAVIGGLQASAIVALGRIFDKERRAYSGAKFLNFAEKHPGIFTRQAFEVRQARAGVIPHAEKAHSAKVYEFRPGDLKKLRREFEAKQQLFEEKVAPIRHQVYAHTGYLTIDERDTLFAALPLRTFEDLVVFPLRVERTMFQLYHNGAPPVLDPALSLISDVIKSPLARGVSSWEHLHAAKNVAAFLDWLRETPLDDDSFPPRARNRAHDKD